MKEVALVVLINEKGEVLAVSRKDNHEDMGLIGGKIDEGETIAQAAVRETKEETGLDITNLRCIFQQFRNDRMGYTFLADYSGEIHTDEPHVVKWTSFETINNGSFGEWNKIVTQTLLDMNIKIKLKEDFKKYAPKRMKKPQMFESYPMGFLSNENVKTHSEAVEVLGDAVRLLHKISRVFNADGPSKQLDRFYEFINEEDFFTLKMYLTECYYDLHRELK